MKYSCDIGKSALQSSRIVIRVSAYQFLLCKEETQVFWRHHDVHSINNNMYCILYRENILIVYKNSMEEIYRINLGMNFVTIAFLYRNWSVPHFFATSTTYMYIYK